MGILWWDPAAQAWVPIDCVVDPKAETIEADLEHFSRYSVQDVLTAKAGW
jgi:hypothetical protein